METHIQGSNLKITEVKLEPQYATPKPQSYYGYSHVEIYHENAVTIKKEECASATLAEINPDTIAVTQNMANKIKLASAGNDLLNSSHSKKEPGEENTGLKIKMLHVHKICKKSPARFIDLNKHIETCNQLKCDNYKKKCTRNSTLKNVTVHGERYKCTFCSRRFKTRKFIFKHMQSHARKKTCKKIPADRFQWKEHVNDAKKCQTDSNCFIRQGDMSKCSERHYRCEICNKCFRTKDYLSSHMKIHSGERNHKCEICTKSFTTKQHLSDHVKIHTGERNYKCEICTKSFITKGHLLIHTKTHTGERNYKCDVCIKSFVTNGDLSKHMIIHTDERNYKCEICTKCFLTKARLSSHMKTHTGEGNYECETCTKRLITKQSLSNHMKIHTGERNYKCEICTKCFITKQKLSNHMTIHTGERNYKCEICTKRFVTKWHLSNHMKIHTGEKDFKCEMCAKCFTIKQNLSSHMKIHSREGKYKCEICTKRFVTKQNYSKHLKMHTGKRNVFLEYKKMQTEENYGVDKIENVFIKEEIDTVERESSTGANEGSIDAVVTEEKPKSTEIFNLWQSFNSEIVVKEEENI